MGWIGAAAGALLVFGLMLWWAKPRVESALRARIEAAAGRHGLTARIREAHLAVWPMLRLEGVELDLGHALVFRAEAVSASWLGRTRLSLRAASLTGPAGLSVVSAASDWQASGLFGRDLRLTLQDPPDGLTLRRRTEPGGDIWSLDARGLPVGTLFSLRHDDLPLLDGGSVDGQVELRSDPDGLRFSGDLQARGAQEGALALALDGSWQRQPGRLDVPRIRATVAGASLTGTLTLTALDADPAIDLVLGVNRLDFAQLLGASGSGIPESLGLRTGGSPDLGSVAIDLTVRGRLADPASIAVTQKIDFKPPHELPPSITRLRGDFPFSPVSGTGQNQIVEVSPASRDFIALRDVPPLFLRTLLLAEDSAFYGHRGIDLRELPSALITNWTRGGAARGASTLSQQLAKNLFLSRDKQVGRKLQELAITFLLESALGKDRILEIYLNIIEWGPDLRGLRPASRAYFGREPAALTPAEMAFLVSIIPGPILYQRSFANGTPNPGLRSLIDALLTKLRSVDALTEAEYQQALADPLLVNRQGQDASGQQQPDPLSSDP
jgi:hypothetical protein